MKKFLFFFLVLCTVVLTAFGQLSNSEIAKIISQSREYNGQVVNPDLLYPEQVLTYQFLDGTIHWIEVEKDDYQWKLVQKLDKLIKEHGPIVDPDSTVVQPVQPVQPVSPEPFPWWVDVPWVLLFVLLLVLFLVAKLLTMVNWKKLREKRMGKFSANPATEGKPFVSGGVNSENVGSHFMSLASRNNPTASVLVTNKRQGYLSTVGGSTVTVEFGDKTKQKLSFRNEPAFAAMVSIGGRPAQEEYFFQACGNPVYSRRSMKAGKNLVFTTEPIIFGDEPAATIAPVQETTEQKPKTKDAIAEQQVLPEIQRSEYDTQTERAMMLAKDVLGKDDPHEVTIEIPKGNDGSFKLVIKTQYPQKGKEKS